MALASTAYAFNVSILPLQTPDTVVHLSDFKLSRTVPEKTVQKKADSLDKALRELELQRSFATSV